MADRLRHYARRTRDWLTRQLTPRQTALVALAAIATSIGAALLALTFIQFNRRKGSKTDG